MSTEERLADLERRVLKLEGQTKTLEGNTKDIVEILKAMQQKAGN
jgi:chaperonin cofactor prefoldin